MYSVIIRRSLVNVRLDFVARVTLARSITIVKIRGAVHVNTNTGKYLLATVRPARDISLELTASVILDRRHALTSSMERNGASRVIASKGTLVHIATRAPSSNSTLKYINPQSATTCSRLVIVHAESSVPSHMLIVSVPS